MEKSKDEKVEQLNEKVKELKEADKELKTNSDIELPKVIKEVYQEQPIVVNRTNIESLIPEAEGVLKNFELSLDMNEVESIALLELDETINKLKNNSDIMSSTESLDCVLSILNNMKILQKNTILGPLVSSFVDKLVLQLPDESQQVLPKI